MQANAESAAHQIGLCLQPAETVMTVPAVALVAGELQDSVAADLRFVLVVSTAAAV